MTIIHNKLLQIPTHTHILIFLSSFLFLIIKHWNTCFTISFWVSGFLLHVHWINFQTQANYRSCALGTVGSAMTIGLSINRCSRSEKPLWQLETSSSCSDFKGLKWFRPRFLFCTSIQKTKRGYDCRGTSGHLVPALPDSLYLFVFLYYFFCLACLF